jgi:nanoRNase/pAp phosphatase (c-di-AMP/oligoRNAs hydrolase)
VVERINLEDEGAPSKKWEEFCEVLRRHRGERILVVLTGYPDPDSIASGLAHTLLAKQFDIDTTLLCFHEVSHQQNCALVKLLEIDLQLYSDKFDLRPYSAVAFVDTQKIDNPISDKLIDKGLLSLVDHHARLGDIPAEFVDIRKDASSTSAVYAEYLRAQFPKGLNPGEIEHVRLATALMHGIRSDTMAMLEAGRLEFEGAAYLWPCVDQSLIKKISTQFLKPVVMDMLQKALERKQVFDNIILTDVGFVRAEHRDGIPQVSEFLLQREGIDTVLVFGIVDGTTVDGSMRTRSDTIKPDTFLKKTFGLDEERQTYYGGGNVREKGGFQIPLGFLAQSPDRDLLYRIACEAVQEKFLAAVGRK